LAASAGLLWRQQAAGVSLRRAFIAGSLKLIRMQEIDVYLLEGRWTMHIIQPTGTDYFLAEVLIVDQQLGPFPFMQLIPDRFADPAAAFSAAIRFAADYALKNNQKITRLDNPCNCELIDSTSEMSFLAAAGLHFPVTVNGK
jgi:hypothetical protein